MKSTIFNFLDNLFSANILTEKEVSDADSVLGKIYFPSISDAKIFSTCIGKPVFKKFANDNSFATAQRIGYEIKMNDTKTMTGSAVVTVVVNEIYETLKIYLHGVNNDQVWFRPLNWKNWYSIDWDNTECMAIYNIFHTDSLPYNELEQFTPAMYVKLNLLINEALYSTVTALYGGLN